MRPVSFNQDLRNRLKCIAASLVVATSIVLALPAHSAKPFIDDFDRSDGPVGNGWEPAPDNQGTGIFIVDGRLSQLDPAMTDAISRPVNMNKRVFAEMTITEGNGFGGLLRQYSVWVLFGGSGMLTSGYGVVFARSDELDASRILLTADGNVLATFPSPLPFGESIDVKVAMAKTGEISGSVISDGQTFNYSFPAFPYNSGGDRLVIRMNGPDPRSPFLKYPTVDNITVRN